MRGELLRDGSEPLTERVRDKATVLEMVRFLYLFFLQTRWPLVQESLLEIIEGFGISAADQVRLVRQVAEANEPGTGRAAGLGALASAWGTAFGLAGMTLQGEMSCDQLKRWGQGLSEVEAELAPTKEERAQMLAAMNLGGPASGSAVGKE